jgi:ATP-dependent Lhr-like helicase
MSSLDLLAEPIKKYIYDKRWDSFRPIQESAISYISTTKDNYILSSKTASGKTEAAFLPILSLVDWSKPGVPVVYISPLIALINDQFERVEELCLYMQIPVTKWHGEANLTEKKKLIKDPHGILLITPESIEALLVNKPFDAKTLFQGLQFVIIDEIHSFLGTERGIQLQSLLYRLQKMSSTQPRYIGLSATLGDFLQPKLFFGNADGTKILRDKTLNEPHVEFHYYESDTTEIPPELIEDIYKRTQFTKSLIFPNTRGRVEEIAVKLKRIAKRENGHENYFAHHSSIERDLREYIEHFAKSSDVSNFSISCTSTLELGIDIGTIDEVIQVDSTHSVSSLIQRLGRSGRKNSQSRLILYATNEWSLLQSVACYELFREGYIEPVVPILYPFDILFHQILSIAKQTSGVSKEALTQFLMKDPAFRDMKEADADEMIKFMLEKGYLQKVEEALIVGLEAERVVNSKEFYSVFKTSPDMSVKHNMNVIGYLPDSPQIRVDENVFLAARIWKIVGVDKNDKVIEVQPAQDGKRPVFIGGGGKVHPRIWKKMLEILLSPSAAVTNIDEEGIRAIMELRKEFSTLGFSLSTRPLLQKNNKVVWYTFTGTRINNTLLFLLKKEAGNKVLYFDESSQFEIEGSLENAKKLLKKAAQSLDQFDPLLQKSLEETNSFTYSKWGDYLNIEFKHSLLRFNYFDVEGTKEYLDRYVLGSISEANIYSS